MEEFSRRALIRTAASGMILSPSVAHSQPSTIPPEWAAVSPGVVDLASNYIVPIYNQEHLNPGSVTPETWSAGYGSLAAMFRQWSDCGLARWIQENVRLDAASLEAPPLSVFTAASQLGMALPDHWWDQAARGVNRIRREEISFQHGERSMLEFTAGRANSRALRAGPLKARHNDNGVLWVQDWDPESTWTKVGGIMLILSGAIALAFGTPLIVGIGIAAIGIGVAFVAL